MLFTLVIFSLVWVAVIYGVNCAIARRRIAVQPAKLALYVSTMTSLGLFGEMAFDTAYKYFVGHALWEYRLLPIHSAYTSVYSLFLWGAVGFHLYLLHTTLRQRSIAGSHVLALLFCLEAVALEALVNISYHIFFGGYVYYYLPSDLGHITSLQTVPLYLLAGYITVTALRYTHQLPRLAITGSSLVVFAILVLK